MADTEDNQRDWLVPAIVVAAVVLVGLIIVIIFAAQSGNDRDDTIAGQLEQWSSCLRAEGANVPLVEALRDGGFRITVDGSLVDDGIDMEALGPAIESCEDEAPEAVQRLMDLVGGLSSMSFGDFGGFSDFSNFEDSAFGPSRNRH